MDPSTTISHAPLTSSGDLFYSTLGQVVSFLMFGTFQFNDLTDKVKIIFSKSEPIAVFLSADNEAQAIGQWSEENGATIY